MKGKKGEQGALEALVIMGMISVLVIIYLFLQEQVAGMPKMTGSDSARLEMNYGDDYYVDDLDSAY